MRLLPRGCFAELYCIFSTMKNSYKISYMNACIRMFARRFGLPLTTAALYLSNFKGLRFLDEYYQAEHLLSLDDALDDLVKICQKNGGNLI